MANIFDQDVNYLLRLPCEILVEILNFLDVKTVHKNVALTCKHLYKDVPKRNTSLPSDFTV